MSISDFSNDAFVFITIFVVSVFVYLSLRGKLNRIVKLKPQLNILGYSIIYSDTRDAFLGKEVASNMLYSEKYDLRGKPDYIYKNSIGSSLIPVELKSGEIKDGDLPREGDLMQLVAYFLMIEDIYKKRPKQGRIIYKDYMFVIRNTYGLRRKLLGIIRDMRRMLEDGNGQANASFVTCRHCVCRGTVCEHCQQQE